MKILIISALICTMKRLKSCSMIIDDLIRILNSDDSSSEILKILNLEEVIELAAGLHADL